MVKVDFESCSDYDEFYPCEEPHSEYWEFEQAELDQGDAAEMKSYECWLLPRGDNEHWQDESDTSSRLVALSFRYRSKEYLEIA